MTLVLMIVGRASAIDWGSDYFVVHFFSNFLIGVDDLHSPLSSISHNYKDSAQFKMIQIEGIK